jgi:hypothetical protein
VNSEGKGQGRESLVKKVLMCVTRLLDRPFSRTFEQNISNPAWRRAAADLVVFGIGKTSGNNLGLDIVAEAGVKFVYLGDVPLSEAIKRGIIRGIEHYREYGAVGFIDDDAKLKDPIHAMRQFLKGPTQGWGAFGPINPAYIWQRYRNKPGSAFHEIPLVRCTSGCQVYGMPFLLTGRRHILRLLDSTKWWPSHPLFMMAHKYGFKIGEVYTPFVHIPHSQELKHYQIRTENAEKAWRKRQQLMLNDTKRIVAFFEKFDPAYVPYAKLLERRL